MMSEPIVVLESGYAGWRVADPVEAIRAAPHQRRLDDAKRLGHALRGLAVTGVLVEPRRTVLAFDNGLRLAVSLGTGVAGAAATWALSPPDRAIATGVSGGRGLPGDGEVEFLLPRGIAYTWRWRDAAARMVGSTVVMCSGGFRDFNLHCRELEVEFNPWRVEPLEPPEYLLVFNPF